MKNILQSFLFSLIVISLIPACSENDYQESTSDETGSISFNVEWIGAPSLTEKASVYTRSLDCEASNVDTVTFEVLNENDHFLTGDSWGCSARNGTVSDVLAGTDRKLIVEGKDNQERVLYRGGGETSFDVTAGQDTNVGEVACDPVEIIDYAFLQYRTYEDQDPQYRGWIDFSKEGNPIEMSDITQIALINSAGNTVYLGVIGVVSGASYYSDSHYSGTWNDSTSSVEFSGPSYYTGFTIGFPETSLPSGDYTYEATTSQEEILSITVFFPGETPLPTVSNADMNYAWSDNSLSLSWVIPEGEGGFDDLRIILMDQDFRDLLYVTLPVDANELTVPSGIIQDITDLKNPNEAIWIIQTRSFTTTIDENNYARGYSSFVNIPWQP